MKVAVEVVLCFYDVLTGTTSGKGTKMLKCTEQNHKDLFWGGGEFTAQDKGMWRLICLCALCFFYFYQGNLQ